MQRILLSLAVIVAVGGATLASTGAFFNDTETSTGNTFTAGAIDLTVDSTQHYNNAICTHIGDSVIYQWQLAPNQVAQPDQYPVIGSPCDGTWTATNLGPSNKFFNFSDVKPADQGENTVSMHLLTNPAWACADISLTGNADNGVNGPETLAGDTTDGAFAGELAQNLSVFIWNDNASTSGAVVGDNIYQVGEKVLTTPEKLSVLLGGNVNGLATTSIALADSTTGTGPLSAGASSNIGIQWCAGTFVGTPGVNLTCDGSTMGNNAQTDSVTADITMRVSQSRNQPNFTCSTATVAGPQTIVVTGNSLAPSAFSPTGWFLYDDQTDTIQTNSAGHQFVVGPLVPTIGTGSLDLTKTTNDKFGIATNQYIGTKLSTLTTLAYSTYRTTGTTAQAPSLGFDIDSDTTDGDTSYQGRLTYEPYFTHTVNTGNWQTWNTQDNFGTGNWWFSHANLSNGAPSVCTQANPCTWSEMLAAYPNIGVSGRVILRTNGATNEVADMNADNFTIGISGANTTYDFGN